MIRDLNISEMERVSGGIFSDDTQPTHWLETTWDDVMSRMNPNYIPSDFGGDEVVATGEASGGFWDGVFDALDLNGDGDLYDEASAVLGIGAAVLGFTAMTVSGGWLILAVGAGVTAAIGAISADYMDDNPSTRIW